MPDQTNTPIGPAAHEPDQSSTYFGLANPCARPIKHLLWFGDPVPDQSNTYFGLATPMPDQSNSYFGLVNHEPDQSSTYFGLANPDPD